MAQAKLNICGREIDGVLLDVDGTLVDSNDSHALAFVEAFSEHGYGVPFDRIRPCIGMGAEKLIPECLGHPVKEATIEKIRKTKSEIFMRKYLARIQAFPYAKEMVIRAQESGAKLGIASSADAKELRALLKIANVSAAFPETVSVGEVENSKPDPDVVLAALRKHKLDPAKTVLIGDTPYDVEASKRAGIAAIGFKCGGRSEAELAGSLCTYEGPWDFVKSLKTA